MGEKGSLAGAYGLCHSKEISPSLRQECACVGHLWWHLTHVPPAGCDQEVRAQEEVWATGHVVGLGPGRGYFGAGNFGTETVCATTVCGDRRSPCVVCSLLLRPGTEDWGCPKFASSLSSWLRAGRGEQGCCHYLFFQKSVVLCVELYG